MTEHYTIKELAEAKGTSAPVRAALLALEARVLELEDELEADGKRIAELETALHDIIYANSQRLHPLQYIQKVATEAVAKGAKSND